MTRSNNAMLEALHAGQPRESLAGKLQLYGQFVGSWHLDIEFRPPGGPAIQAEGEWYFAWALDGTAVQDVFIFPARRLRSGKPPAPWHMYGMTFRWFDPAIDAWHINYYDPGQSIELRQIGRAVGSDIVQVGENHLGLWRRWRFVEITPDSFRWIGEASWDKGATWNLEMEMRNRRTA